MAIKSGAMSDARKDVADTIQNAIRLLTEQLSNAAYHGNPYKERHDAKRCFEIFEETVGRIDLTAPNCGSAEDVKYRIGLSLAKKEIVPGLNGMPSEAALNAIFEEWDRQPEEGAETA